MKQIVYEEYNTSTQSREKTKLQQIHHIMINTTTTQKENSKLYSNIHTKNITNQP